MSTDTLNPTIFEQLDALAYLESDRFCDKCAYNLRGQPVRRDPGTQLVLCRCPECGAFHPAGSTSNAPKAWTSRFAVLALLIWIVIVLWLLGLSIGGQFALMGATMDELGRPYNFYYYYGGPRGNVSMAIDDYRRERWESEQNFMRWAAVLGSAAIGLVSAMLWTIIFPHWRRWGYRMMALATPAICLLGVTLLMALAEIRWVPEDATWLLLAMFGAHLIAGLIGSVIGRPVFRGLLTLLIPARARTAFAFLWMVDGKKPPHAATHPG